MAKTFSKDDVASHSKGDNLWIIIDEDVYDVSKFQDEHPGGKKILQRVAGKDASKQFWKYHNEGILKKYKGQLQIGSLNTKKAAEPAPKPAPAPTPAPTPKQSDSSNSSVPPPARAEPQDPYGDLVPLLIPRGTKVTPLPTSTKPMPLSVTKFASGSSLRSSPMSTSGTRARKSPATSISRWVSAAIWPVCSVANSLPSTLPTASSRSPQSAMIYSTRCF